MAAAVPVGTAQTPSVGRVILRALAGFGGFLAIILGIWILVLSVCLAPYVAF
jgi:hypothetical protein